MQQEKFILYMKKIIITAYLFTSFSYADALASSAITLIDSQYNSTTWAAENLLDADATTQWMSRSQSNNLNFQFSGNNGAMCFNGFELTNYGGDDRGVNQFILLTTQNEALSADAGSAGWKPMVADENPIGYIDYLSWAQGARQVFVDGQYNTTTYAAKNINDGNRSSRWLSRKSNNILQYNFDTDWDGSAGNGITINELEVTNYGVDDRSVKQFQVEITNDGTTWRKLQVPGTAAGDVEYIYSRYQDGGTLGAVDSQYNATSYHAENMQDGDQNSQWLSRKGNNTIEFTFDPNNNGITGADGDTADVFAIDKINIENYGNDDRSVKQFQLAVKTLANPNWHKVNAPGAIIGEADYNFAMSHHGGALVSIDSEYNSTSYGAKNIHDGDQNTLWLSRKSNNELAFQFDANEDGTLGAAEDLFILNSIYLRNYGNDDRAIKEFQLAVKTKANPNWAKINVPGASIGQANYNFAMSHHGGTLVSIDSEYNSTSYGAKNIHDGDLNTLWLSRKSNNELAFQFDADENGTLGAIEDLFTLKSIYLVNYGNDDRSIKEFQIAVKTRTNPNWAKINTPGATVGQADYNFALAQHGGNLIAIDSEYNATNYGAKNIHDGDQNSLWLSRKSNNTLDFQFDVNEDGIQGGAEDVFTLESFYLVNYGNDDRAIKKFQVEVKTLDNSNWTKLPVSGAGGNTPDYNFALTANGGSLTVIDSEHNSTNYGAKNIHDGDNNTRWLSSKQTNTLAFSFDSNFDGVMGDAINVDTISLINYGNNDVSIQTFEVDVQISGGAWQAINAPAGGTVFTATMDSNQQNWAITSQSNVTALRLRTLSNYGDATYTGATEFKISGTLSGQLYTYSAAMHGNGETFSIAEADQPIDVTGVRLRTITNYGDPSYIGARELKLQGTSVTESKTFIAAMHANGETFTFDSDDVPEEVTDVKLITISNHGDPSYVGAKELKLQGPSVTETKTFLAAMHGNGESFTLDNVDVPVEVTDVKLVTISNHGDPSYVGAKELKLQGPSVTETKTFIAAMQSTLESFQFDTNDIPIDVTDVKLTTINNHGDPSLIGLREFEVVGKSVTAASTFTLPMNSIPFSIVLDNDDTVSGIIGARIVTIKNHGDSSLTGVADFKLLGNPITPSYIFTASNITSVQNFNFSPVKAKIFRFHSMNNHGDPSYTGAADFALNDSFCANPVAQYSMDETQWSGVADEVIDSSGTLNGQAFNGATTFNDTSALTGNPGTCAYGVFDGVDDYVGIVDNSTLDLQKELTITAWINPQTLPSASTDLHTIVSKDENYEFHLSSTGEIYWWWQTNEFSTSGAGITTDNWYHIAITYKSGEQVIYVNGIEKGTRTFTDELILNNDPLHIGQAQNHSESSRFFDGFIDEVQLFDVALTQTEVQQVYTQSHACAVPVIHHYEIVHDGNGLTCAAEPITIKACTNSDCSSESTEPVSLQFNITSPQTGMLLKTSATFTGTTSMNFSHTIAETIVLSIDSASITASNAVECSGFGSSCDMNFTDTGFQFLADGVSNNINTQLSGKPSNTGFNSQILSLQAIRTDSATGACEAVLISNVDIELAAECTEPSTCSLGQVVINDTAITTLNDAILPSEYTKVSLDFGDNIDNTANIVVSYPNAGKIQLHARFDISIEGYPTSYMLGNSNQFVVRPLGLYVNVDPKEDDPSVSSNPASEDASGNIFKKAGEQFNTTITAKQWQQSDDTNNDGIADLNDVLSDNPTALNFISNVILEHKKVAPNNGELGTITGESFSLPSTSTDTNSLSWSEVGIISFTAKLSDTSGSNNYLGAGPISSTVPYVGRFTPAYFKQSVKENHQGNFDAYPYFNGLDVCAFSDWAYTGQRTSEDKGAITYSLLPKITITAYNANDGVTKNYTLGEPEGFMKLLASGVDITLPTHDKTQQMVGSTAGNPVAITAFMEKGNLSASLDVNGSLIAGEWLYTFSSNDHFSYNHNNTSLLKPFEAKIPFFTEKIEDSDGVLLSNNIDDTEEVLTEGVEIRFARMVLENAYGAENAKLRAPLNIQVYNGIKFKTHTDESCLTALLGDKESGAKYSGNMNLWDYRLIDIGSDAIEVSDTDASISGVFVSGSQNQLIFAAPEKQGMLEWEYEVPSWLKFKWNNVDSDNDGNFYDDNPSAVLSFGFYRGNDRIISWREVVN